MASAAIPSPGFELRSSSVARGYEVPPAHWAAFLQRFVERHAGAPCQVGLGRRKLPLHGARIARRSDGFAEIVVTLGDAPYMLEPYFVVDPVTIRVEALEDRGLALRLEARAGQVVSLSFDGEVGRTTGPLTLVG